MGQITSSVGLISGINTGDIIDQLIALESRPKLMIQRRSARLTEQQTAFQEINAKLLAFKNAAFNLSRAQTFNVRSASSSRPEALGVTATAQAPIGTHSFTVKQLVSSQSSVSRGLADRNSTAVADGKLTFQSAEASLKPPIALADLRGGEGVARGRISITDRAGRSAVVDLSTALSLEDVLSRINNATGIDVRASLDGDRLQLADLTGQTLSNLVVREVGSGRTASDLGLLINEAQSTVSGERIRFLTEESRLSQLNEGLGVRTTSSGTNDLRITDGSGHGFEIDLAGLSTIGQVIDAINGHTDNNSITAALNAEGTGLVLSDAGGGGQPISVAAINGSRAAVDLGLRGTAASAGADLEGLRLIGSLESRLLGNLNGGRGVSFGQPNQPLNEATRLSSLLAGMGVSGNGEAGSPDLSITTRAGQTYQVDLDHARTVGELASAIHAATRGRVSLEVRGDTLVARDHTSGGGNFSFSDANGSSMMADLGLDFSTTQSTSTSDNLNPMVGGTIQITNRLGNSTAVDLSGARTLDDVIRLINDAGAGVTASIAGNQTSLLLTDTTGSTSGTISVDDVDGTAALDLGLAGSSTRSTHQGGDLQRAQIGQGVGLNQLFSGRGIDRGQMRIIDSSGQSTIVDLRNEGIRTLGDVINAINTGGINVFARINDQGDGLIIEDHGLKSTAIRIEDISGSSAADLGIVGSAAAPGKSIEASSQTVVNLGVASLLQSTELADLNGGEGVKGLAQGDDLRFHTADGSSYQINVRGLRTLEELFDRIETTTGGKVTAQIDGQATGLRFTDSTSGDSTFRIEAINGSSVAESLGLIDRTVEGGVIQTSEVARKATLEHITDRINNAGAPVRASIINDGSGQNPFRLSLQSTRSGLSGAFLIDDHGANLGITTMARASNAALFYGSADPATALVISGNSNTIRDAIPGVTLDLKQAGDTPITVSINRDDSKTTEAVSAFVDAANAVFETFDKYDQYDKENEQRGLLMGDSALMRTRASINQLFNSVNRDVDGQFTMPAQVGIRIGSAGKVEFDAERFNAALANDHQAVMRLFTMRKTEQGEGGSTDIRLVGRGVAVAMDELLGRLTDADGPILRRNDTLSAQLRQNEDRIKAMDQRLAARRLRLEAQFNQMEQTLARLQEQQTSLGQIQFIQPMRRDNNGR
ncbi:MAG: flagellar filament capping protein FliD [Phycisphaeraceae bacterium]|nr:flagellar filament capping protein FliD [Phycisphaeraceae bacterium]